MGEKKFNWLAVISILLAVLFLGQTIGVIYYLNQKSKAVPSKASAEYARAVTTSAHPAAKQNYFSPTGAHATYQDPWSVFDEMQNNMNQMMGGFMASLPSMMSQMNQQMGIDAMPAIDLEEKETSYVVHVDMPGLDKDKIDITVRGETLTIQGVRETVNEEQSGSYYTQERSYGSFARSLRLPGPVDEANIKAEYKDGVLIITLPKVTQDEASKKISIA